MSTWAVPRVLMPLTLQTNLTLASTATRVRPVPNSRHEPLWLTCPDNRASHFNASGDYRLGQTTGHPGSTTGPHGSNLANKLDPRVDSTAHNPYRHHDRAGSAANPIITTSTAGPHASNVANKVDPRVDSDLNNRARHQALAGSSYNEPVVGAGATAGPHTTDTANKLDPRVDSDLDHRGAGIQRGFP